MITCPARPTRLALALREESIHGLSVVNGFEQSQGTPAPARSDASFPRLPLMMGMAAVGMALGSSPALSDPPVNPALTCAGSGPSAEHPATTVSGAAIFSLNTSTNPRTLTLILKNIGAPTPTQGDTLTGVVFSINTNPSLSYAATANPVLVPGSTIYTSSTITNPSEPLFNGTGSSWTNELNPNSFGSYGVATTGYSGLFNAGSIKVGNGGPNHSITAPGNLPSGGGYFPVVQNALQFVFTTTDTFTEADITGVKFLYGTDGNAGLPPNGNPIPCVETDFGDAPDPSIGTAAGTPTTPPNYNTTLADGGPSHVLGENVYLGLIKSDSDDGTLQNGSATADNNTATDDEDGIDLKNLPTLLTTTTSVKMNVKGTNQTSVDAVLACWIDFNRSGVFGEPMAGEGATVVVPAGTPAGTSFVLNFNGFVTPLTAGPTAVRCRISTDADWKAAPTPVGSAENGEVEDYMANGIYEPCVTSPITSLPAAPPLFSGVQFTVSPNGSMTGGISSIQCQKTINIDPATGITFVPPGTPVVASAPPTWTFTPAAGSVQVTARKMSTASGTIACTATDSAGHTCSTDPWFATGLRLKGSDPEVAASQLIPIVSRVDDYVTITNGQPGIRKLEITVNSTKFKVNSLQDGEKKTLCITSAMRDDTEGNSIYIVAKGRPGGSAEVMGEPGNGRCN